MSLAHCFAHTAHLIGHPSRALMLDALLGRSQLSVTELADAAGITIQTASVHLQKLHQGGLISVLKQGKRRLYCIANQQVMDILQQLATLVPSSSVSLQQAHHKLRVCYGHMAGEMAIQISEKLCQAGLIVWLPEQVQYQITAKGFDWLHSLAVSFHCYPTHTLACLDWTERKHHIAGWLGHELLAQFVALGYVYQPSYETRVLLLTDKGQQYLAQLSVGF